MGADAPLAGEAHGRAVVDPAELPRALHCGRVRCSAATRRSSPSSSLRAAGFAYARGRIERAARDARRRRPCCSPGCRRRSRRRGRRATSRSSSARSCVLAAAIVTRARARRHGRARRRPLPLVGLQRQEREGEREADRGPAGAVRAARRARRLDASRAGAGAPLLPRRRAALGDDARPGRATRRSSTGATPSRA